MGMAFSDNNLLDLHYLLFAIWGGSRPEVVWPEVGAGFPGGHFWMHNLNTWDGFTQLGLVIG